MKVYGVREFVKVVPGEQRGRGYLFAVDQNGVFWCRLQDWRGFWYDIPERRIPKQVRDELKKALKEVSDAES